MDVSLDLPPALHEAMRRAVLAEDAVNRVYPLFATTPRAADESRAFGEELARAHREALLALRSWRVNEGSIEDAAASYERLASLLERFASRAGLDASELD